MLELARLLISSWLAPLPGEREWQRKIRDAETATDVGRAVWQPRLIHRWLGPLWPAFIEVREIDDEPLLFTARRVWALWPRWEIADADQRGLGSVRGSWLTDLQRRRIAQLHYSVSHDVCRIQAINGDMLATMTARGAGQELHFAERLAEEPFLKMLVLAFAVTL